MSAFELIGQGIEDSSMIAAEDLGLARYNDAIRDLTRATTCASRALHVVQHDPAGALDAALQVSLDIDLALTSDLDLGIDSARDLARDIIRDLSCNFGVMPHSSCARATGRLRTIIEILDRSQSKIAQARPQETPNIDATPVVATSAQRAGRVPLSLVVQVVRRLPATHQPRYNEEWRAELAEIAQDGGAGTQFLYALRLAVRLPALRRALRAT
jgi:hypothetical protein